MGKKSRTQKAARNIFFSLFSEAIKLVCSLILPRLILTNYGSAYNGIVSSITQFISCIALMKLGIGGATKVALYKPLANKDNKEISEVLASTESFMRKIARIFVVFVLIFACLYPLLISNEFGWLFSASLILIISLSTFAEYYFGFTYSMLLNADQKSYIEDILAVVGIILNTVVAVILINNQFSIHIVKLGSSLVHIISPIFMYVYCHKKYNLIKIEKPQISKIPQRWDAFAHEIASFVNDNTDIMILTMFTSLLEVSVYTIYHSIVANLRKMMSSFVSGFGSAFGDMYAREEKELLVKNLSIYELITYSFTTIIYSTALVMFVPFVMLYTEGVTDVDYNRLGFCIVITLAGVFDCFRFPYKQIINNTGFYKQTKFVAIGEAVINIVISILCVAKFGLVGVAVGTLITMIFGSCMYSYYISKHVIERNLFMSYKHMLISLVVIASVYLLSNVYMNNITSYYMWILYAIITFVIAAVITIASDYFIYNNDMKLAIKKIRKSLFKR